MSAIEPTTTVEQYGTNVRVTQDWSSVLDKIARDIAYRIDEATLARLGYVKQRTCHVESSIIDTYEYNRWEYELSCGHVIIWEDSEPPNYCPDCGRKVVVE